MTFVAENPKLLVTAISGLVIFVLKTYVLKDSFTPEISSWLDIILSSVVLGLLGRFSRVTKSEAIVLEKISDNKNQLKGDS
jgi:hypothetical protein